MLSSQANLATERQIPLSRERSRPANTDSTSPSVEERFSNLLLSPSQVKKLRGRRSPGEVSYEESEQGEARRQLLHIEKIAKRNKLLQEQKAASFLDTVGHDLHEIVLAELQNQIANPHTIFTSVLGLNSDVTQLLETIYLKGASISRIEPLAANIAWINEDIMAAVNAPLFRRQDAKGRVIAVESLRTALNFLGMENLRLLFPQILLQQTMPQQTDLYPQMKVKLQQYAVGTAVTARELAFHYAVKPNEAFLLAILSNFGRCAINRIYFKLFEQVQRQMLLESQRDRLRDLYDALLKIRPSTNVLIALQHEYADKVAADLCESMGFKRLSIDSSMRSIAQGASPEAGSLARIVLQARAYTQVRMLYSQRNIDLQESRQFLAPHHFPAGSIEKLKSINIFQPALTFAGKTK